MTAFKQFQFQSPLLNQAFIQGGHWNPSALKITYYVRRTESSLFLSLSPISLSRQRRLMPRHLPPGTTLSLHYWNKALFPVMFSLHCELWS